MVKLVRKMSIVHQNTVVDWLRIFLVFQPERVENVVRTVTALLDKYANWRVYCLGKTRAKKGRDFLEFFKIGANPFNFKITNNFLLLCE